MANSAFLRASAPGAVASLVERPAPAVTPSLYHAADLAGDLAARLKGYAALVKLLDLSPPGAHLDSLSARELAELLHRLNEGAQAAAAELAGTLEALVQANRARATPAATPATGPAHSDGAQAGAQEGAAA